MAHIFKFKETPFETRYNEAKKIKEKYPERIPVIVEKFKKSDIADINKTKYLVPYDLTIGQFIHVIRKQIRLKPSIGIYLFVNNTLPSTSETIMETYEKYGDNDGFLYLLYSGENTFGYLNTLI